MKPVLIATSTRDFDPSEVAIPWKILRDAGVDVCFATDTGTSGQADPRMVDGRDLGVLRRVLMARADAVAAYGELLHDEKFRAPVAYDAVDPAAYAGLLLPGGHAKGVKPYLESPALHSAIAAFFARSAPVGAICHGVVAAARSIDPTSGKSVLYGRKTTALLNRQERLAYHLTRARLGDYYLTYPVTVEDEVTAALQSPADFHHGPTPVLRDTPARPERGFALRDGNYLSARWPGDVYTFANGFLAMLREPAGGT